MPKKHVKHPPSGRGSSGRPAPPRSTSRPAPRQSSSAPQRPQRPQTTPTPRPYEAPPRKVGGAGPPSKSAKPAKNISLGFVLAVIFIFVLVYMASSVYAFKAKPSIGTETVKMGSIDVPKVVNGVIVRSEAVYQSPAAGALNFAAAENERVSKGALVCSVENVEELAKLKTQIGKIDEDIKKVQDRREGFSPADDNSRRINAQIKSLMDSKIFTMVNVNVRAVYAIKDSVTQNVDTRNAMILSEGSGSVRDLTEQRRLYRDAIDLNTSPIYALQSGVLCVAVDGFEEVFTPESMDGLTREQTRMKANPRVSAAEVEEGAKVFKLVTSNTWYIAAYIPADMTADFKAESDRTVYIEKENVFVPVETKIHKITQGAPGADSYVIFRCTRNMIEFMNMRELRVKTTDSVKTGLKIPNSAITFKALQKAPAKYVTAKDSRSVLLKEDDMFVEKDIGVFWDNGDYILIKEGYLRDGDVLANPEDHTDTFTVHDTEEVPGVFRVNNGTAEFKMIFLPDGDMRNSGYTILDPESGQGIKPYDNIVSDAAGVTEGQIIR